MLYFMIKKLKGVLYFENFPSGMVEVHPVIKKSQSRMVSLILMLFFKYDDLCFAI